MVIDTMRSALKSLLQLLGCLKNQSFNLNPFEHFINNVDKLKIKSEKMILNDFLEVGESQWLWK